MHSSPKQGEQRDTPIPWYGPNAFTTLRLVSKVGLSVSTLLPDSSDNGGNYDPCRDRSYSVQVAYPCVFAPQSCAAFCSSVFARPVVVADFHVLDSAFTPNGHVKNHRLDLWAQSLRACQSMTTERAITARLLPSTYPADFESSKRPWYV